MLLPAAARLLPVLLLLSIMLFEPLGRRTEFLRTTSFLPVPISFMSLTLGNALEFLQSRKHVVVKSPANKFTYRFVMPVFRLGFAAS